MEYFESLAIPSSPTLIKWQLRYIDDVHSATRKDHVKKLQEHLNSIDPHIKFTIECPGTDELPFLDTLTKPTPNSIESSLQKTHPHNRYLGYSSNHSISAKLCVVHTLIHRAKQICSTPEFLAKEMDHPPQSPTRQPLPNTVLSTRQTPIENQQIAKSIHRKTYRRS